MSAQETAREHMAQQRQHQQHLHESMRERGEEELVNSPEVDIQSGDIQSEARAALAADRQKANQLDESMLRRSEAEVNP